jgi:hypothetical protein
MNIRKTLTTVGAGLAVLVLAVTTVSAAVTFDAGTGEGFVGKGDVQLVYGWNNKDLQDNATDVEFRVNSVSETTWTCTKPQPTPNDPEKVIVQNKETTTSTHGLLESVARTNSKGKDGSVTGFNLERWDGDLSITIEGDAVGTCPANPSGFTYDNNAETTEIGGGLEVSIDGTNWNPLQ